MKVFIITLCLFVVFLTANCQFTPQQVKNLEVLGKTWGFLKYYHPVIARGKYKWDEELLRIMPAIINSKSNAERNAVLSAWIIELGKTEPRKISKDTSTIVVKPDLTWIENWQELGVELSRQLKDVSVAQRDKKNYYLQQSDDPPSVYPWNEESHKEKSFPDTSVRLLALFRYWNIVQYFYPYRNLIENGWDRVLPEYIAKLAANETEDQYYATIREMIVRVQDSNAELKESIYKSNALYGRYYAPFAVGFVEEKLCITKVYHDSLMALSGLRKGDVITAIWDKKVSQIIKDRLPGIAGTHYAAKLRNIEPDLMRGENYKMEVDFVRDGIEKTAVIHCTDLGSPFGNNPFAKETPAGWKLLSPDIGYMFVRSIKADDIPKIMNNFKHTKGMIIDLRSLPYDYILHPLGNYLMPVSRNFIKCLQGSIEEPGQFTFSSIHSVGKDNKGYYKGKVVILINEQTRGYSEFLLMGLRVAKGAVVIGSNTSGSAGDRSKIELPGYLDAGVTTTGYHYPDGRNTRPIAPDIVVKPTINGIRNNKDEVLDRAISIIKGKK